MKLVMMRMMKWLGACAVLATGCGTQGAPASSLPDDACTYVRHRGLCEANITLDPRESESPDEATILEVRWEWLGEALGEVPPRTSRSAMTAREAHQLAVSLDELGKSPCVVEQAIAPDECSGRQRIVWIEAGL